MQRFKLTLVCICGLALDVVCQAHELPRQEPTGRPSKEAKKYPEAAVLDFVSNKWREVHADWPTSGEAYKTKSELIAGVNSAGIAADLDVTTALKAAIGDLIAVVVSRSDRAAQQNSGDDEVFHSLAKWDLRGGDQPLKVQEKVPGITALKLFLAR